MSSSRDNYHYSHQRSSRSSPQQDSSAGLFSAIGQGGRTILPPLPSAAPTSRSPAPTPHPTQYPVQRSFQSQSQYEYGLPATAYPTQNEWYGTPGPATVQPQASTYPPYQDQQQRYPSPYYSSQSSRPVQPAPTDVYDARPSASQPQVWDDQYGGGSYAFSSAPAHAAAPSRGTTYDRGYQAPAPSYPSSYSYNPATQPASTQYSYAPTPAYEPRNTSTHGLYADPTGFAQPAPSRSVSSVVRTTRTHAHATSSYAPYTPYTRHHPYASTSSSMARAAENAAGEDATVKKKRKRADALQLKVLNEVYDRNPFPPTAEREALAVQLGMTPRSVQIWFQNKRQAAKQGGRSSTAPSTSSGRTSTTTVPASHTSSSTALPGPSANMHSSSSLAYAVGVPSASAPRGSAGYVASPPRTVSSVSPPRVASVSPPYLSGGVPQPRTGSGHIADQYGARRSPERADERAVTSSSSRTVRRH